MTLTLIAAGALLAGCSGEAEPADPPTGEDALTSETAPTTDAAPTTEAPPDDVVETSSPPDVVETTEVAGPPELPDEATEDSEAGAAAFAEHYLNSLNYSTSTSTPGLLDNLADPDCQTCQNFQELVDSYTSNEHHSDGPVITFDPLEARSTGESMVILASVTQPVPATLDKDGTVVEEGLEPSSFEMAIRLHWVDDGWKILEIQAE
ncbi:DUF6318 family protein [Ornithinimicrobium faecis]|uniref:DUF6318 family protein n=1 Tax=Ornithinimicrobium faecis TaxID=2934158 RepID=A0ABY4YZD8_9MICO|nr:MULTISPECIES: DUF6318 family protein [unclassified Ornithinimicrobium]USQ82153.1 DUF6318 family protein [Ornithinimicrobium sp. HY1793]